MIVSFLGVVFQDHQFAGVCVAVLCCASIMAFFAFREPYLYSGGNVLSVVSYGSLLASYIGALTRKLESDEYTGFLASSDFKNLLFIAWLLPFMVWGADTINVHHYVTKIISRCRRRGHLCSGKEDDRKNTVQKKNTTSHINATFTTEYKRGIHVLSTLQSLLPIVQGVSHAARAHSTFVRAQQNIHHRLNKAIKKKNKSTRRFSKRPSSSRSAWDAKHDGAKTLAIAEDLDAHIRSMIEAFTNGGRESCEHGDAEHTEDKEKRASSLTGNYRPLFWRHFIGVEIIACKLSQIAYPITDVDYRIAKSAWLKVKIGCVRTSFITRQMLWDTPVAEQLRHIQRATSRFEGKEMEDRCTHPSMKDIRTWREVLVAILKPNTDFGWHIRTGGESELAISVSKSTLRNEQSLSFGGTSMLMGSVSRRWRSKSTPSSPGKITHPDRFAMSNPLHSLNPITHNLTFEEELSDPLDTTFDTTRAMTATDFDQEEGKTASEIRGVAGGGGMVLGPEEDEEFRV